MRRQQTVDIGAHVCIVVSEQNPPAFRDLRGNNPLSSLLRRVLFVRRQPTQCFFNEGIRADRRRRRRALASYSI
jgi:hypothetical protein